MTFTIHTMTKEDYSEAFDLWQRCQGIGLTDADSSCGIGKFLDRNPGLSFIARQGGKTVGTCLCGSDGRRGYLYHLAVDPEVRRQGIGQALVEKAFAGLRELGIQKCHILVFKDNELGLTFWQASGWKKRTDIDILSYDVISEEKTSPC